MKLAIVGSQAVNRRQAEQAWVLIEGLIRIWDPDEIWSGGATGIDSVAEAVAMSYDYWTGPVIDGVDPPVGWFVTCLPEVKQWDPVGRKGYRARNIEIVHGVDRLVRVAKKDGQLTYGSGWTADYAEEQLGSDEVFRYYI